MEQADIYDDQRHFVVISEESGLVSVTCNYPQADKC